MLTPQLTMPSKADKELFLEQILQSDLRLDTYELKKTKIRPIREDTHKKSVFFLVVGPLRV